MSRAGEKVSLMVVIVLGVWSSRSKMFVFTSVPKMLMHSRGFAMNVICQGSRGGPEREMLGAAAIQNKDGCF